MTRLCVTFNLPTELLLMIICLDPGHGLANRKAGVYDPGAVVRVEGRNICEADVVLAWTDELRAVLMAEGHRVIRTRAHAKDPAPLAERVSIAQQYKCAVLLSLHCNAADGKANGTETYYRGARNQGLAAAVNAAVCGALGTRARGSKTETASQHARLAVLSFPRSVLLEIGFLDHTADRLKMLDEKLMLLACQGIAEALNQHIP